jgi:hypothetical protein
MKIACRTVFNCMVTGVTGHFKPSQIPFQDRAGQLIDDQATWNLSRNQQRNWETLLQVIGLGTQPTVITLPYHEDGCWHFEFETATDGVYSVSGDPINLDALYQDCKNVPMIVHIDEQTQHTPVLCVEGIDQNIWFETVNN